MVGGEHDILGGDALDCLQVCRALHDQPYIGAAGIDQSCTNRSRGGQPDV
jgi:ribulose bisphosphate carboxylase small subunit